MARLSQKTGINSENCLELRNMFRRSIKLPKNHSFFLFGPRGSGKSTLLKSQLQTKNSLFIDLLEDEMESRYSRQPDLLLADIKARQNLDWVIVDEVQKVPKLLDTVHKAIFENQIKFALTGSSSRKLKRGGGNLLAGRAFLLNLFSLTIHELADQFDLDHILTWGSLPQIFSYSDDIDKRRFLQTYAKTYLKEEILLEQLVRNIDGFRDFLEISAQMSGKNLNFTKIGVEAGIDSKTVKEYFQILEDTLIGFWVPSYSQSVRKSQKFQPKFYFSDLGIQRALDGTLGQSPTAGTSVYGVYFECFLMSEVYKANRYSEKDYKISHYQTTNSEIDLVLSKGRKNLVAEIKSTKRINATEVRAFSRIAQPFGDVPKYYVSQDPSTSKIEGVRCLHFVDFLEEVFGEGVLRKESAPSCSA